MVNICAVFGCNNNGYKKSNLSFHRFPYTNSISVKQVSLAKQRRHLWYQFIKRKDVKFEDEVLRKLKICSAHFVSGKPAKTEDTENVDWVPTLNAPTKNSNTEKVVARHKRWKNRAEKMECVFNETSNDCNSNESASPLWINTNTAVQTEESMDYFQEQIRKLQAENSELRKSVEKFKKETELLKLQKDELLLKEAAFIDQENDDKIKFYTGLPNLEMLYVVKNAISSSLIEVRANNLTDFQKVILTLMKLRLNCSYSELAYRFQICTSTASKVFQKVVILLKHALQNLIHWPDKECLKLSTPRCFQSRFGHSVVVIIDCFEICTQKPATLKARNQSWSSYKQKYTAKYLIGITPYGVISFISNGFAGHTTDTDITEQCGIMRNLKPGDVVLADRGFLVREAIAMQQAELKTPAFKNGQAQLHSKEVEESREISSVRIHVERVIGSVRQKYQLLNGPVPISLLKTYYNDLTLLDYSVHVACILTNLSNSIVEL